MPKRSPEDLLRSIEEAPTSPEADEPAGTRDSFDDAVAQVMAMTPAERKRELEAAGVDVKALHADTAAMLGRAAAPVPPVPSPVVPMPVVPMRRRRPTMLLALAATLAACAAAAAAAVHYLSPAPPPKPPPPAPTHLAEPPTAPLDVATLRREGVDACKALRWQECKDRLDLADRYDPAGSADPIVAVARAQAALALAGPDAGDRRNQNAKQGDSGPQPATSGPR